ncbi:MAG: DUF4339 domain-containing protein [Bacteriovoracaceae bacterium]
MKNFLWTDMSSEKWYVIYAEGHEGPYSLQYLESKIAEGLFNLQTKVWAEGLAVEMTLEAVLTLATPPKRKPTPPTEDLPPLPPLPQDEEIKPVEKKKDYRPINLNFDESPENEQLEEADSNDEEEEEVLEIKTRPSRKLRGFILILFVFILLGSAVFYYVQDRARDISIYRPQGMSLKVADKINENLEFQGWNAPLFFKEFIADDYNTLWLASSSFHKCEVSAHFKSQKDKLLSLSDEEVEFAGEGILKKHLTEFKKFNFVAGKKIVPGMYDMTIEARNCEWGSIVSRIMNFNKQPQATYSTTMTVILYPNGVQEFRDLLDRVVRKKLEKAIKEQNQIEMFWQGIQERLQTLLAVSLQIEQHFIDFIKKDARKFNSNLPPMIKQYTEQFGQFLTNFVVSSSESFKDVNLPEIKGISARRNYEKEIAESARMIGHSSMKIIEDFQKMRNPRRVQLNDFEERVKKEFSEIKNKINQKIIQVSDDRSLPLDEDQEVESPSEE